MTALATKDDFLRVILQSDLLDIPISLKMTRKGEECGCCGFLAINLFVTFLHQDLSAEMTMNEVSEVLQKHCVA